MAKPTLKITKIEMSMNNDWVRFLFNRDVTTNADFAIKQTLAMIDRIIPGYQPAGVMPGKLDRANEVIVSAKRNPHLTNMVIAGIQARKNKEKNEEREKRQAEEAARMEANAKAARAATEAHRQKVMSDLKALLS